MKTADPPLSPAETFRYYNARVPKLHKSGSELRAPCPIHQGKRDSLSVNPDTGVWFCHSACGRGGNIYEFETAMTGLGIKAAREEVLHLAGRSSSNGSAKRIVDTYNYTDEQNQLLFQCVRFDPKDFKQRRPDGRGGWIWNLKGVRLVVYRLPELVPASKVFVVEGEKDADAVASLGLVATCNPMGAGKWRQEYAEFLRGKEVYVIPDDDEPGRKHVAKIIRSVSGVADSVRLLALPGAKDAAEWIEQGGTLETLAELTEQARQSRVNGQPMPDSSDASADKETKRRFVHNDGAIFWVDEEADVRTYVCSELQVVAYTCDVDGNAWGRVIVFRDRHGREHRIAISMELFAGEGVALREVFLGGGGDIGTSRRSRELFPQYIQSERPGLSCICVPRIGWHSRTFVFPDATIPRTDGVLFQTKERLEHAWRTAGTLRDWVKQIGEKCTNNLRLVFAVSMGFAAPLLGPLKVEGGGVHVVGITSSGKTTAQAVAGSACGGGPRGFYRSWRTTSNAIEAVAELHNDALLVLDELSEMPNPREIDATVYMLANGQGKARATASAALQRTRTWLTLFLSSGEITLSEHAQTAGVRVKGGSEVRLLNIPADAGAGLGVFEDLHGARDAQTFANELKAAAGEVYGTPLRAFLEKWAQDWEANCAKAKELMDQFLCAALVSGAAPEVGRAMRRIALIAAAGELATMWKITGWPHEEAWRAALRIAQDWIAARGGVGLADIEAGITAVRCFIATRASSFQSVAQQFDGRGNEVRERMSERAGFWRDEDDERMYLIFPDVFRSQICPGRNSRLILQELLKRDLLIKGEGEHLARYERIPNEGRIRLYAIRSRILEGGIDG